MFKYIYQYIVGIYVYVCIYFGGVYVCMCMHTELNNQINSVFKENTLNTKDRVLMVIKDGD